jgi:hypothetical protein
MSFSGKYKNSVVENYAERGKYKSSVVENYAERAQLKCLLFKAIA